MRPLPGTAGGGVCMARRGAISSAVRRPSRGRRRLRWGRELGAGSGEPGSRGALPRGKEGEGGRTRRRDNTRRRPHKRRGRGEMEQGRGGGGACVTACPACCPFRCGCSALDSAARRSLFLFSSRRAIWVVLSVDFCLVSLPGWRGSLDSRAALHLYRVVQLV